MAHKGSPLNYVLVGARMGVAATAVCYALPLALYVSPFSSWFLFNAACQLALFVPVVVVPALVTGHMAYVDIGWPCGLVILAINCLLADGYSVRRYIVGGCVLLHGLRMFLGALVMFYPYRWKQDLPRYRYARVRWVEQDDMPAAHWPLRMVNDLLGQAFANAVVLAAPPMLCAHDTHPEISPLEVAGWVGWLLCWALESLADGQKLRFLKASKADRTAVLGFPPFADARFWLWTRCRHPNYFFEW